MSGQISGHFLEFTNEEIADISGMLTGAGYEKGIDSLKDFILDCVYDTPDPDPRTGATDRVIDIAQSFVKNNPEKVRAALNTAAGLASLLRRKK